MGIMDMLKKLKDKILPSKEKLQVRNNIPKEKENIKKSFGIYCNAKHGTKDGHICPKCTALLVKVMTKIKACPYGATKPVCELCDIKCFKGDMPHFIEIMDSAKNKMLLKHPVMAVKHRLLKAGTDYAKSENAKKEETAARAKRQAKRDRKKKRDAGKAPAENAEK